MAQHTRKWMSTPQQATSPAAPHWGRWLRSMIRAAGYKNVTQFRRAVGCGRRQIHVWLARADAPHRSPFDAKLAGALGLTVDAVLVDWRGVRPTPALADVRAAVLRQLAADAARLDLASLYSVATLAALLAQLPTRTITTTTNQVGDAGQGTGEGAGPLVPGDVEDRNRSHVQPAPAETPALAFSSSRVGGV